VIESIHSLYYAPALCQHPHGPDSVGTGTSHTTSSANMAVWPAGTPAQNYMLSIECEIAKTACLASNSATN
jgi:hypothetical protein